VKFFLTGIGEQAKENSRKAKAIMDLYKQMKTVVEEKTRSQFVIKTLDTLFTRPVFSSTDFVRRSQIPKASAARILTVLHEARVLRTLQEGSGRRPAYHEFSALIRLVER
jgi:transcription initiation factor IIE alpha subunit